ncbi:hypothetical protein WR164_02770 [Philodulcilactobacillus myokoensis]|uniref:MFS transporter n=1 Tax=Philodulcilactobacillus myokoensis TaxID=2929573 RepID=A0A9W6ESG2_9LACO|nr:hypothetical protein [Philodulcilactobacillus myokoensis]GLB46298.1 hypothetical protein WR164_02770 [Philodulcilactobacillus myokoensis]
MRTTLISLNNTFNAGATLIALVLNGWLSDQYSVMDAWIIMAVVGFILALIGYVLIGLKITLNQ